MPFSSYQYLIDVCAEKAVNLEHLSKELLNFFFPKEKILTLNCSHLFHIFFPTKLLVSGLIRATHQLFSYINTIFLSSRFYCTEFAQKSPKFFHLKALLCIGSMGLRGNSLLLNRLKHRVMYFCTANE